MNWCGDYPEDFTTVAIYFTTHDVNGAPVAPLTGYEAADVTIYKNGSATQKTSTNGVTMTSPFDSIVGLHCVVIDTSNDTADSGFWTTGGGGVYSVVLIPDTETVNGQTTVKVVGTFGIKLSGATTLTAAQIATGVWTDTTAGDFTTALSVGKSVMNGVALGTGLTVATVTNQLTAAAIATGVWTDTVAGDFTAALSVGKSVMNGVSLGTGLTVNAVTGLTASNLDATISSRMASYTQPTGFLAATFPNGTIANTTNITSITGNITGNLSGSVGSVTGAVGSVTGLTAADVGSIKTKTDSLTFTVANKVDCNIRSVNSVTVAGDGAGTPWGP